MNELFAICRTNEIDDGQAMAFVLMRAEESGEAVPWPVLITRKGNQFFGFENACPHLGLRLDERPGEFLDEDANFLTCGNHHAQFDLDTGHCFIGPCQCQSLKSITLIDDGDVCVTGAELAEEYGLDRPDPEEIPYVMITGD